MKLGNQVTQPVLVELKTLYMAIIDVLEEYDQKVHWNTSLIDYKNKKDSNVCTLHDGRDKYLCKSEYVIAGGYKENTLVLSSPIHAKEINGPLHMWEARFPMSKISLSQQENEDGEPLNSPNIELKTKNVDPGNINVMTMDNMTIAITDFFDEIVLQFSTGKLLGE